VGHLFTLPLASLAASLAWGGETAPPFDALAYEKSLNELESRRSSLAARHVQARGPARRAVLAEARRTVLEAITRLIFPAWLGTPWGLGKNSTSTRPHQPGMVVGCSYFVTSVLQNAGLRLENRFRFAQATSALMQAALSPDPRDLHRIPGMALPDLEKRIAALGDGVYIVGLDIHTGFLVVREGEVRVVHASYTGPTQVVDEPLRESMAIQYSMRRGYLVSPIFRDDRLIEHWLAGRCIGNPGRGPKPSRALAPASKARLR
jgi:hypothetical protein